MNEDLAADGICTNDAIAKVAKHTLLTKFGSKLVKRLVKISQDWSKLFNECPWSLQLK